MTPTPRVAIVGAGLMGRWHAHACRRAGGRLAAVVDLDEAAAVRLARAHSGVATAGSLDGLPDSTTVDIVHVCTPADTHVPVIRAALARRCSVIVEKPLAPDAVQTEQVLAAAAQAGVWVIPVHQTVCQAGVRRARRWAGTRTLRLFDYRACSAGADASPAMANAVAAEILPHPLALIDLLAPGALDTIAWTVTSSGPGELAAAGVAGGTLIRLLISMHARPTRHDLTLASDSGSLVVDLFHGFAWREPGVRPTRAWKIARPFAAAAVGTAAATANLARRVVSRELAYPGLSAFIAAAYRARVEPARRPVSDAHTRAVARARDAILLQVGHF